VPHLSLSLHWILAFYRPDRAFRHALPRPPQGGG